MFLSVFSIPIYTVLEMNNILLMQHSSTVEKHGTLHFMAYVKKSLCINMDMDTQLRLTMLIRNHTHTQMDRDGFEGPAMYPVTSQLFKKPHRCPVCPPVNRSSPETQSIPPD